MARPTDPARIIAIVGSAYPARTNYEPPLRNTDIVERACADLGRALAHAGYRIMVYSPKKDYIESDIVESYVGSGAAREHSVVIRYPDVVGNVTQFKEQETRPELFYPDPDDHENWQVSFYTSLKEVDGILLLGGGNSALITGLVAHMYSIPLVCIGTFGGSAHTVWSLSKDNPLFTAEERQLMNAPTWSEDKGDGRGSAARLIPILEAQRRRKEEMLDEVKAREAAAREQQASQIKGRTVAVALLLALTASLAVWGFSLRSGDPGLYRWFIALFLLTPVLAGATGGVAGDLYNLRRGAQRDPTHLLPEGAAMGAFAGFISAVLFAVAQAATNYKTFEEMEKSGVPFGLKLLFLFVVVISLIAGFTADSVLPKIKRMDAMKPGSLLPAAVNLGGEAPADAAAERGGK